MNHGVFFSTLLLQLNPGQPPELPEAAESREEQQSLPDDVPEESDGEPSSVPPEDEAPGQQPPETRVSEVPEAPAPQQSLPPQEAQPAPESAPVSAENQTAPPTEAKDPLGVDPGKIQFKAGKGLSFESNDGSFKMALRSRFQLRHEYFHDPEALPDSGHLLMVRRARLNVGGHVFGEHNKYKLQLAFAPRDIQLGPTGAPRSPVLDAIAEFDHLPDATLSVGQFMVPWNRQRIVSSGDFELVDRSIASNEFQLDRDIGIQLSSNDVGGWGRLRYLAAIFNGEGRDANQFADAGLLYVGRVEFLPFGDAKSRWDYEEGHLERSEGPRISLGAAYAYHHHAARDRGVMGVVPSDGGTTDMHVWTADFVAQWAGLSLTGEFYRRDGSRTYGEATVEDDLGDVVAAPRTDVREGSGYFIQGGYVLPWLPLGFAARYSRVAADAERSSLTDARELGGGPSYYFGSHDFKIQADYFRLFEEDIETGIDFVRTQLTIGF